MHLSHNRDTFHPLDSFCDVCECDGVEENKSEFHREPLKVILS